MNARDLTRPHYFQAGSNRTFLLLHGTGADEHDLVPLAKLLDSEAGILSPRGLYLEGGMNRFFERYSDGSFNEESIDQAVSELADFLEVATEEYGLAGNEFVAVGFSNGANTAAAIMVRYPTLLSAGVLLGSTRPFAASLETDLTGKRIWIGNGDQDPYAPIAVTKKWIQELEQAGAEVNWLRHAGGHQVSQAHLQEISRQLT
ncbi:MAG: alpha/beta hydrolase [Aquiluna sp.]|nr:alpha/beta hydrolase [Aquiluna sp.]